MRTTSGIIERETPSVWSYAMRSQRATLAAMRLFLSNQEEIAQDTWIFANRHAPPSVNRI